jgi:hypothetical protein
MNIVMMIPNIQSTGEVSLGFVKKPSAPEED